MDPTEYADCNTLCAGFKVRATLPTQATACVLCTHTPVMNACVSLWMKRACMPDFHTQEEKKN